MDIDREAAEQIRRMQRYFYKINNGIGTVDTNHSNIKDALRVIDELRAEGRLSQQLQNKVEHYRQRFLKINAS